MKLIRHINLFAYQRFIILFLLLSIVPVVGFGLIVYVTGTNIVRTEVNKSSFAVLTQAKEQVDLLIDQIQQVTGQFAMQTNVNDITNIGDKPALGSILPINQMRLELANFLATLDAVESIYYYHYKQNIIVTSSIVTDLESGNINDKSWEPMLQQGQKQRQSSFWIAPRTMREPSGENKQGISYVKLLPLLHTEPKAALIVNLDIAYLTSLLNKYPYNEEGGIILFSNQGELIAKAGTLPTLTTEDLLPLVESTGSQGDTRDSREWKLGGQSYYMTIQASNFNGWTYASLVPTQQMYKQVNVLKQAIILCTISLALLALLMSLFSFSQIQRGLQRIARLMFKQGREPEEKAFTYSDIFQNNMMRIEKGVSNLLDEMQEVRVQWQEQLPLLKDTYLLSALVDNAAVLDKLLQRHPSEINLFHHPHFVVLIMEMDQPGSNARFTLEDEKLFLYGVANIASECLREIYTTEIISTHKHVAAVLNIPAATQESEWMQAIEIIQGTINRVLKQSVTIAVGRKVDSFQHLSVSYHEAVRLLHHTWIRSGNEIISVQSAGHEAVLHSMLEYPTVMEERILEGIRTGDKDLALQHMETFGATVAGQQASFHVMRTFYLQLLVSIVRLTQQYEEDIRLVFGARGPFVEFLHLEGQKAVQTWIAEVAIGSTIDYLGTMKQHRKQALVTKVLETIRDNYNRELSLQQVADQLKMTVSSLSLLFKETVGENFIDYVTSYRIEKAKELLLQTDINISQIAVEIGYNNAQQLIRAFKRVEGITPGDYRSANRLEV